MDLKTTYMGIELKHPIVASSSPLSESLDGIKRLEDSGAAAVVLFSLFEEQLHRNRLIFRQFPNFELDGVDEPINDHSEDDDVADSPEKYLELIRSAADAVDIPIIASLNCVTADGWTDYACRLEQAGANGLELNVYSVEPDLRLSGAEVEQRYVDILRLVKCAVAIPVAMKLSPFFSSFGHMARCLQEAGADALVVFNRFYQPDIDIEHLELASRLQLSTSLEIRLPLLWIALLHGQLQSSIAASSGVESPTEVVKYLLAGADAVMTASSLLRNGPNHIGTLVSGLEQWMEHKGIESVNQMKGLMSYRHVENPKTLLRSNYIRLIEKYALLIY